MTIYDFVENLWLSSPEYDTEIDIQTATEDLDRFRGYAKHDDAIQIPEDITPELYMQIWNELVGTIIKE